MGQIRVWRHVSHESAVTWLPQTGSGSRKTGKFPSTRLCCSPRWTVAGFLLPSVRRLDSLTDSRQGFFLKKYIILKEAGELFHICLALFNARAHAAALLKLLSGLAHYFSLPASPWMQHFTRQFRLRVSFIFILAKHSPDDRVRDACERPHIAGVKSLSHYWVANGSLLENCRFSWTLIAVWSSGRRAPVLIHTLKVQVHVALFQSFCVKILPCIQDCKWRVYKSSYLLGWDQILSLIHTSMYSMKWWGKIQFLYWYQQLSNTRLSDQELRTE